MSTGDLELEYWIKSYWILLIDNRTTFSATTVWLYDYIDTLPTEILVIWSNCLTITSSVFLINRYGFLIYLVFSLAASVGGTMTDTLCRDIEYAGNALWSLTAITTSGLLTMRAWCITGYNRKVFAICGIFVVSASILDIYSSFGLATGASNAGSILSTLSNCGANEPNQSLLDSTARGGSHKLVARQHFTTYANSGGLGNLVSLRSFYEMERYTFCMFLQKDSSGNSQAKAGVVDKNSTYTSSLWSTGLTPYLNIFPNLIMNRLVLNLKSYSDPHSGDVSATLPLSELRFNIVLGNIGAPVEPRQNTRSLIEDDILFVRNGSLQGTVMDPVEYGSNDADRIEMV
ncbi:uncharacterized protein STEHIDRAFT_112822 [Stereum hirsutum FP-91666 SS1]|uniref:uncharacterized protein n=1 Tax=Stereum hirsutum (strain FP-91666) TaxID=721885 RepID=UPI0004449F39|nr:uncharacterized protein STEHIDRAFT_112822 [Stereum hirsutum FP-91666 SS1]EIM84453.1 hypothetical protein STEHIDRAFT_112822 [Stereum hirsutum FP-91666 SS1]